VSEFREARGWLDRLPRGLPVVVTAGNHDVPLYRVWERLTAPFRNYREWISPELDAVTRIPGVTAVSLCSAAPHRAIVNGRIRPRQLEFAERAFREGEEGAFRVLMVHHHLAPAPDYEKDHPVPGAGRILESLEGMEVELVLSGHLHRAYIGNSLDVYPGEDRERGVVIVHSGTTTSRRGRARERAKQSFNLIRVSETRVEIMHYMNFASSGGFEPFSAHLFPRRPALHFQAPPFQAEESGGGPRLP